MSDDTLRSAVFAFQKKNGTSITFIANKCGVSREHLSRWLNSNSYSISEQLKGTIIKLTKGEM
ncbi:hypothetical protein [Brevibacillus porteri]|uniref:XRE family transcriptional regulator n=1 Tax=Brevibacillus porteri TaxID=2126350 RepID=A0ABX5FGE5_9BACL|nr:hypothetical protein [Brevibacillus porteri]MED1801994.1 hypothetical protein [Brevibacillus porteri]MED2132555.1 hypothetical protein [Brevibacillus porteri]MED2745435.1 hypothetical protein [Brevibacillus porteri]MED2814288.1 hypothetical protein [Brevibacillus porteri]MED2892537.1 hypothetical protein [Brevibacillus porteri]